MFWIEIKRTCATNISSQSSRFPYSSAESWKPPIHVSDWLILCCGNLRLQNETQILYQLRKYIGAILSDEHTLLPKPLFYGKIKAQVNFKPKIHRSVPHKITIDLLYFWDVYDVNLWENKRLGVSIFFVFAILLSNFNFISNYL